MKQDFFGSAPVVAEVLNAVLGALTVAVVLVLGRRLLAPRDALIGALQSRQLLCRCDAATQINQNRFDHSR